MEKHIEKFKSKKGILGVAILFISLSILMEIIIYYGIRHDGQDGKIAFVEVKAPGEQPRPLQRARHELLRRLGFKVFVLDNVEKIGGMIDEIRTT